MNEIFKKIFTVITFLAALSAIIGLYFQFNSQKPSIEIQSITKDKLTGIPEVDGLKANFFYKDSIVSSLWKLNYLIRNNGDAIIIGEGNKKNIIKNDLRFYLPKSYKILESSIENEMFPLETKVIRNKVCVSFLQWRPEESFELVLYAEQKIDSIEPFLVSNDREIVEGSVVYTSLQKRISEGKVIFEYLPKTLQYILKWLFIIIFSGALIILPIIWIVDLVKYLKYKRWFKRYHFIYEDWVYKKVEEGKISLYHSPKQLPNNLWNEYPYIKPTFPDNEFSSLTTGVIAIVIFAATTLMLLIKM